MTLQFVLLISSEKLYPHLKSLHNVNQERQIQTVLPGEQIGLSSNTTDLYMKGTWFECQHNLF